MSHDATIDSPGPAGPPPARSSRRHASAGRLWKPADPRTGEPCAIWWLDYSIRGKRYRESTKTTVRAEAARLLRQRITEHGTGRYAPNADRMTLDDLGQMLRTHYELEGLRSLTRAAGALERLREHFGGDARAVDLTTDGLAAYAVERKRAVAPGTAKYELAILRKAFSLAVDAGALARRPKFPAIAADNVRTGFFESGGLEAVLAELPEALRPPVRFAAITGWRKAEVLNLTWDRVDFGAGVVRLDPGTTKNRAGRTFPFAAHPALAALLTERRAYNDDVARRTGAIVRHVFQREGRSIKSMDHVWRAACKRAGVPGMLFHDLRRTAVRNLVRAGVSEAVAMKLTGHKTRAVFDRYDITSGRDLAEAVGKLAAVPAGLPQPRQVLPLAAVRGA
jgi:integrase